MERQPPIIFSTRIKPEWVDYNAHMNVAYYVLVFDHALEELLVDLGLGEESARRSGISTMTLESHITYDREVALGQDVEIGLQLVDHDHKRMHLYLEMHVAGEDGYLASTLEQMTLCVDLNKRRSADFPEEVSRRIEALARRQAPLPRPENIGRRIGIRR